MRLVEQHVIARTDGRYRQIDAAAFPSKNQWNAANSLGHTHRLQAGTFLEVPDGIFSLDATQTTQIAHEDHGPMIPDLGHWLVLRQREDSPMAIDEVVD